MAYVQKKQGPFVETWSRSKIYELSYLISLQSLFNCCTLWNNEIDCPQLLNLHNTQSQKLELYFGSSKWSQVKKMNFFNHNEWKTWTTFMVSGDCFNESLVSFIGSSAGIYPALLLASWFTGWLLFSLMLWGLFNWSIDWYLFSKIKYSKNQEIFRCSSGGAPADQDHVKAQRLDIGSVTLKESMNCIHSFSNFRPWAFLRIFL